jgi:hypothetical protein
MRDRCQTRPNHPVPALIQQELIRESSPGDLDLDGLAQAIRELLDSGDAAALHSRRDRATHVMGAGAAKPL